MGARISGSLLKNAEVRSDHRAMSTLADAVSDQPSKTSFELSFLEDSFHRRVAGELDSAYV